MLFAMKKKLKKNEILNLGILEWSVVCRKHIYISLILLLAKNIYFVSASNQNMSSHAAHRGWNKYSLNQACWQGNRLLKPPPLYYAKDAQAIMAPECGMQTYLSNLVLSV